MLPSPRTRGLGLRSHIFSRPPLGSRALRPGDSLAIPQMASSVGFIRFVSSTDATQATKVPDSSSDGTNSHRPCLPCLDTLVRQYFDRGGKQRQTPCGLNKVSFYDEVYSSTASPNCARGLRMVKHARAN